MKIYIAKSKTSARGIRNNVFYPVVEILEDKIKIKNDKIEERTYKKNLFEIHESCPAEDD